MVDWDLEMRRWKGRKRQKLTSSQSVKRKGGKKGPGSVYIICSLNPKHKQRQGK